MAPAGFTVAREKGLRILAAAGDAPCRVSNTSSMRHRIVYWQTAAWLEAEGYAKKTPSAPGYPTGGLTITAKGRKALAKL